LPDFPDLSGKKILQVIPELSSGGAERTVLEVTEALRAAGARALLFSRGGRLESRFDALGGELFYMDSASRDPATMIINRYKILKIIAEEGVDLVHARSRAPAWSALWAARAQKVPFVTTYHGIYSGRSGPKRFYNSVMARGDLVIANSQWTADHIKSVHGTDPAKIITIPRGVDASDFEAVKVGAARRAAIRAAWSVADDRLCALLPGRLTDWKGQRLAIAAFAALPAPVRAQACLILAGDPQGRRDYVALLYADVAAAGLQADVRIFESLDDMPGALAAADIVLQPSTRPEAFGRIAIEASAMERPVIVADHGGARETVVDGVTGRRVVPGDAASLAAGLKAMIECTPEARARMGAAGREYVQQHFSTRGLQAATLGVYKRLLDQARQGSRR
jgi:glycosyltransferase involved in cell wall biosynthesis